MDNIKNLNKSEDVSVFVEQLKCEIPKLMKKYVIRGAAVSVIDNSQIIMKDTFGFTDNKNPIDNKTVFQVGSISKSLTAWGIIKLVEKGKISLDDSVCNYLRRWQLPPSQFENTKINFRRVLSHTAGLSLSYYTGYRRNKKLPTLEQSLSHYGGKQGGVKCIFEPGTKFSYSGGGYTLLQLAIEEITGLSFSKYMKEEILNKLRMYDSTFDFTTEMSENMANGYGIFGNKISNRFFVEKAAAGLYSTIDDLTEFVIANIGESGIDSIGRNVVKPESVKLMHEQIHKSVNYGLGYKMIELQKGEKILFVGGTNLGWFSQYVCIPHMNAGLVLMTNSNNGKYLMGDIMRLWAKYLKYPAVRHSAKLMLNNEQNKFRDLFEYMKFKYGVSVSSHEAYDIK